MSTKKNAREDKKKRNAKINYYIMKLALSGPSRLEYNYYDKSDAHRKKEDLNANSFDDGVIFIVEQERRTRDIVY